MIQARQPFLTEEFQFIAPENNDFQFNNMFVS